MNRYLLIFLLLALPFGISKMVYAHTTSQSFMTLSINEQMVEGQIDLAIEDLALVIGLDSNQDKVITWRELQSQQTKIEEMINSKLILSNIISTEQSINSQCEIDSNRLLIDRHVDKYYAVLTFNALCPDVIDALLIDYNLFFEQNAQHKSIAQINIGDESSFSHLFTIDRKQLQINDRQPQFLSSFINFIKEGIWHIWIGIDHILFIIVLLIPIVFARTRQSTNNAEIQSKSFDLKQQFKQVLLVITAFTIAHSITLALSVYQLVDLPSRLVESIIALSIIISLLFYLFNIASRHIAILAFVFGLIHGMGFASVLMELGVAAKNQLATLVAFNLGVEIGQIIIVAILLPILFWIAKNSVFKKAILPIMLFFIFTISNVWFLERAFEFELLSWI